MRRKGTRKSILFLYRYVCNSGFGNRNLSRQLPLQEENPTIPILITPQKQSNIYVKIDVRKLCDNPLSPWLIHSKGVCTKVNCPI